MKPTSGDLLKLKEELKSFLESNNWHIARQIKGLIIYEPPSTLNFEGKFSIALPEDSSKLRGACLLGL